MDGHSSNLIGEGGTSTNRPTFDRNLGLFWGLLGRVVTIIVWYTGKENSRILSSCFIAIAITNTAL